jgi:hypothetical protein
LRIGSDFKGVNMDNQNSIMIRPNQWLKSNKYKNCEFIRVKEEEYKLYYGTPDQYSAWVQIVRESDTWIYYPLGNEVYKSKSYKWMGDLFDDAIESMIRAKL